MCGHVCGWGWAGAEWAAGGLRAGSYSSGVGSRYGAGPMQAMPYDEAAQYGGGGGGMAPQYDAAQYPNQADHDPNAGGGNYWNEDAEAAFRGGPGPGGGGGGGGGQDFVGGGGQSGGGGPDFRALPAKPEVEM